MRSFFALIATNKIAQRVSMPMNWSQGNFSMVIFLINRHHPCKMSGSSFLAVDLWDKKSGEVRRWLTFGIIRFALHPPCCILWFPRHAELCWGSKGELISNFLQRIITFGPTSVGRQANIYVHHQCENTEYYLEDFMMMMMMCRDTWEEYRHPMDSRYRCLHIKASWDLIFAPSSKNSRIFILQETAHSLVWFGLVLRHINRCRLFNTKSIA